MVTVNELLKLGDGRLKDNNIDNHVMESQVILSHVLGKDQLYLIINRNSHVEMNLENSYIDKINLRIKGMPLQYITGEQEFMSLKFKVTSDTLIPRQDTEILTEIVINNCKTKSTVKILDIGTGSGCIGISILNYLPCAYVDGLDISADTLKVAKENACNLGVTDRFNTLHMDILKEIPTGGYDVIVSNPPYIDSPLIKTLQVEVSEYEPLRSLDGGCDGLTFYRRITAIAPKCLNECGILAFEIGCGQEKDVEGLMKENGFYGIEIVKDYSGINRVVIGKL